MEEFYPMPFFANLTVQNVEASIKWYKDALNFRPVYEGRSSDGRVQVVHLRRERYQDILLVPARPGQTVTPSPSLSLNFTVIEVGVDEIAARARQVTPTQVEGPILQPWNTRELTVYDPDGYVLKFSERAEANRSFKEIMEKALQ